MRLFVRVTLLVAVAFVAFAMLLMLLKLLVAAAVVAAVLLIAAFAFGAVRRRLYRGRRADVTILTARR